MKTAKTGHHSVVDFVGQNIELVGTLNTIVVARTPDDLEAFCEALSAMPATNAKKVAELFSNGQVRMVMSGTRVVVTAASTSLRLRIASIAVEIAGGPHDGLRGWCRVN